MHLPKFFVYSEHPIPVSLVIVSYIFFLPAGIVFGWASFFALMGAMSGGLQFFTDVVLPEVGFSLAFGMFWVFLSRGLRRGSRGWRTCALVIIWLGMLTAGYCVVRFFLGFGTPAGESPQVFLVENVLGLAFQIWQLRVLNRPDVREWFGV